MLTLFDIRSLYTAWEDENNFAMQVSVFVSTWFVLVVSVMVGVCIGGYYAIICSVLMGPCTSK